jgi:hypothetical protein
METAVDRLLLLVIHPVRGGNHHEPELIENAHRLNATTPFSQQRPPALLSARSSFRH